MTEDEMVGWHHRFSGQEFEQAPANGEEQGTLECCSPWGHKELDLTERLNNTKKFMTRTRSCADGNNNAEWSGRCAASRRLGSSRPLVPEQPFHCPRRASE